MMETVMMTVEFMGNTEYWEKVILLDSEEKNIIFLKTHTVEKELFGCLLNPLNFFEISYY